VTGLEPATSSSPSTVGYRDRLSELHVSGWRSAVADENGQLNRCEATTSDREVKPWARSCWMCVAVDGNVAGPDISPETPLGRDGESLQEWMFAGRTSAESQHFETDDFEGIGR
jgi:hypothetical protein